MGKYVLLEGTPRQLHDHAGYSASAYVDTLLKSIPTLHDKAQKMASRGDKVIFSSESKYYPLHAYLSRIGDAGPLNLRFAQLEKVIGQPLPIGARSHKAWWGNGRSGHSQSRAWLLAGWRVTDVDIRGERVTFERIAR